MSVNFGGGSAGDDQMAEALRDAGLHVLAHLYESYAARLFDYCVALLGDEVAAVIAVQDSLVAVDAQISKLPDPDRLRVSLYSVARRQCLGKLPRRRVKPAGSSETTTLDKFAAQQAATADAGAASAEGDTLPVVTAALAGLADRDREVLNLAFRHGIEGADLAAVLGVSHRRARAMLSDAGTRFQIRCARHRGDRVFGPEMLAAVPLTAPPLTLRLRMTRTALALGSYRRGGASRTGVPGGSVVPVLPGAARRVPRAMVVSSLGLVVLAVPGALLYRLALTSPAPIATRVASGTQTTQTPASAGASVISPAPGPRGSVRQHKLPPLPGVLGPAPLGVLPVPPPGQAGSPPTPQPPHTTAPPTTPPPSTRPPTKPPTTPPPTTPPPTTPPPTTPPPTTPPPPPPTTPAPTP